MLNKKKLVLLLNLINSTIEMFIIKLKRNKCIKTEF